MGENQDSGFEKLRVEGGYGTANYLGDKSLKDVLEHCSVFDIKIKGRLFERCHVRIRRNYEYRTAIMTTSEGIEIALDDGVYLRADPKTNSILMQALKANQEAIERLHREKKDMLKREGEILDETQKLISEKEEIIIRVLQGLKAD